MTVLPMPSNEMERITRLSELDIDYTDLQDSLKDLNKLAAKVAGTSVSLINLIDTFTQWTVSNYGLDIDQMAREDSVCQFTIMGKESFEVKDLEDDDRFKDKFYVTGQPYLKYYFGIPLRTNDGINLGALCVMDKVGKEISPEKIEMLGIIANEVVSRLSAYQIVQQMRNKVKEVKEVHRKVAHDIRGPLGGIVSLAEIISSQGDQNKMEQVLEFIGLIQKSGNSLLDLANEILRNDKTVAESAVANQEQASFNLDILKAKLEQLYNPQAIAKKLHFSVSVTGPNGPAPISKNKLLQITGNLISNAIKFTKENGKVEVELELVAGKGSGMLKICIRDSGIGIHSHALQAILNGTAYSTTGTDGETGYGFGLSLVKRLVDGMNGTMEVSSETGKGTVFYIRLPQ